MVKGLDWGGTIALLSRLIPVLEGLINDLPSKIQEINNTIAAQTV